VSRQRGIGAAVAERLRGDGLRVVTAGWSAYDSEHHLGINAQTQTDLQCDLGDPSQPALLIDAAQQVAGPLTALVLAHTHDSGGGLFNMAPELIDRHMAVNVRGSLLLMQAFAVRLAGSAEPGRIVIFTSGPPQNGAIAYAASKGALEWITYSAATELGPSGVTVNAVNPGPNQTGWMTPEVEAEASNRTPLRRAGRAATVRSVGFGQLLQSWAAHFGLFSGRPAFLVGAHQAGQSSARLDLLHCAKEHV
jgi:3-oxoacyl-[acyl-carrier protein] reductase